MLLKLFSFSWLTLHFLSVGKEIMQAGNDKQSKYIKFLGIHFDENLTWKYHIENIQKQN